MTDKELKSLNRKDLLEMLLRLSNENQALKEQLHKAEIALQNRQFKIDKAGSIAEAALQLNGVYEAAQAACQQYMENIESLSHRQETICAHMEAESRAKAEAMLDAARKQKSEMERDTQAQCAAMVSKAKAQSDAYWDEVSKKLEKFYEEHTELRKLLDNLMPQGK